MKRSISVFLSAVILLAGLLAGCGGMKEEEITVFAAASLTETLQTIKDAYEKEHPGVTIVYTFDSSGTLKTQIQEGAACDLFLSASPKQINDLGDLLEGTPSQLLDEPFSALDSHLRLHMEQELQEILRQFGKTALIVSHDREEVYRLADRLAVMSRGKVDVIGKTKEVFRNPQTKTAAILTGCDNLSRAVTIDSTHIRALDWGLELEVPPIRDAVDYVGIRAQDIAEGTGINTVSCRVCAQRENAFSCTVTLRPETADNAAPLIWELPKHKWRQAETVSVSLPPEKILLLKG